MSGHAAVANPSRRQQAATYQYIRGKLHHRLPTVVVTTNASVSRRGKVRLKPQAVGSKPWAAEVQGVKLFKQVESILDHDLGYVFGHSLVAGKTGISLEEKQNAARSK